MKTKDGTKEVDGIFRKYTGKKAFQVNHPLYKTVTVAAPDEASAIVAAADIWGVRWQTYDIYSRCKVFTS